MRPESPSTNPVESREVHSLKEVSHGFSSCSSKEESPSEEELFSDSSDSSVKKLLEKQDGAVDLESQQKIRRWYSLFSRQNNVHKWVIPFILLLDVLLFVWSNNSVGAAVHAEVDVSWGKHIIPHGDFDTFDFSLGNSIRTMWKGKSYALAFLIASLSGAWPYLKSIMLMVCWFVPLPTKWRGRVLQLLDALGKWSLIDMYVLLLMIVAFRFTLSTLGIEVGIVVYPGFGVYSFVVAAMLNLIISHFMSYLHRLAIKKSEHMLDAMEGDIEAEFPEFNLSRFARLSRYISKTDGPAVSLAGMGLVLAFILTLVSQFMISFEFHFEGLVGTLLGKKNSTEYSLVSSGAAMPHSSDGVGPIILAVVFFLFTFVVPLLHIIGLCALWEGRLFSLRMQKMLYHVLEVVQAWSALEVFLVAIVAAILEIGKLSDSIVADECGTIDSYLHMSCFHVEASLRAGIWVILVAVLFTWGMVVYVMFIVSLKIEVRERMERKKKSLCSEQTPLLSDL